MSSHSVPAKAVIALDKSFGLSDLTVILSDLDKTLASSGKSVKPSSASSI